MIESWVIVLDKYFLFRIYAFVWDKYRFSRTLLHEDCFSGEKLQIL